jgi:hypothetical protein
VTHATNAEGTQTRCRNASAGVGGIFSDRHRNLATQGNPQATVRGGRDGAGRRQRQLSSKIVGPNRGLSIVQETRADDLDGQ